jgi:hypothetical protein
MGGFGCHFFALIFISQLKAEINPPAILIEIGTGVRRKCSGPEDID